MIINKMIKLFLNSLFLYFFINFSVLANDNFTSWLKDFKIKAISNGISEIVVDDVMSDAKFLPKVIEYDRYQPEFYEDTFTYIRKRTSSKKIKEGIKLYKKEKRIIENIEKDFQVEKELLLALMGIETNFGKYLGKMDIVSSLATLSYDKRRSDFFTKELLILLKLVDKKIIDNKLHYITKSSVEKKIVPNFLIDKTQNIEELKTLLDALKLVGDYLDKTILKPNNLSQPISRLDFINTLK